nr:MAG TPA: hypothetical protein [Caudoviricetes sp.]DAJ99130.1 MAG TPA: hypothetical protein [Caudoviricetes sp.]DAK10835.1 MAG TPA: hypothetical protein [Caudoviricetes sp.]DAM37934.1 MAG TPA: hypothetical protein [Caudoviricetes sp.]DAO21753.1 MAG TPA: hypothetical protein [Caudoviricetes sp.]
MNTCLVIFCILHLRSEIQKITRNWRKRQSRNRPWRLLQVR